MLCDPARINIRFECEKFLVNHCKTVWSFSGRRVTRNELQDDPFDDFVGAIHDIRTTFLYKGQEIDRWAACSIKIFFSVGMSA